MALPVTLQNFSFGYEPGKTSALDSVSLEVPPGSVCAVLGPSSSGKTTLLLAVSGILGRIHPRGFSAGTVRVGSTEYPPFLRSAAPPRVSMTMQQASLQISGFKKTVYEEIDFSMQVSSTVGNERSRQISSVASSLGIAHLLDRDVRELSGGELHRAALAAAIAGTPDVLLLDEPFAGLDAQAYTSLLRTLRSLKPSTTILFSDCGIEAALLLSENVLILDAGRATYAGPSTSLWNEAEAYRNLITADSWIAIRERLRVSSQHHNAKAIRLLNRWSCT